MAGEVVVLSLLRDFLLPEDIRRTCAFILDGDGCFEYVTPAFKPDIANRYITAKMALGRKYQVQKKVVDEKTIKSFYDRDEQSEVEPVVVIDQIPLERSLREFAAVIHKAVKEDAVDIHWIVRRDVVRILYRIHGRVERVDEFSFSRDVATGILGAVYGESKDASDTSFSTRNKSSCSLRFNDPPVAVRWQTIPTGDSQGVEYDVVLRVTRQDMASTESVKTLEELGYLPGQCEMLDAACLSPGGIIMSGITGSGKTTALRSLMQMARGTGDKKIYTVEDPIELKIYGATQINARGGSMADILKGLLRGDPDIIMVGEVRGREVAGVMQDVLRSGHKMMTTIHAPSALGIVSRLSSDDIGVHRETIVEPGFIAALVYQYLMPTLCPHCKRPAKDHLDEIEKIERYLCDDLHYGLNLDGIFLRNKNGCEHCRRGISGMTICAEVVRLNYEMIKLIRDRKDAEVLHEYRLLRRTPFDHSSMVGKTAYESAIYKVSQGIIDPVDVNDMCGAMQLQEIVRGHYEN